MSCMLLFNFVNYVFLLLGMLCVLFVCKCILYYSQWVSNQLQLTNISCVVPTRTRHLKDVKKITGDWWLLCPWQVDNYNCLTIWCFSESRSAPNSVFMWQFLGWWFHSPCPYPWLWLVRIVLLCVIPQRNAWSHDYAPYPLPQDVGSI